jgi:hypothetical protein
MAQKKGQSTRAPEWVKHLRKFNRRRIWKGERRAEHNLIIKELNEKTAAPKRE